MKAGRARRWAPLLGAVASLAVLGVMDTALKTAPVAGWYPSKAEWVVSVEDTGTALSSFARMRAGKDATKAFGEFISDFQREVRLSFGIRPTILRWRVWMGNYLVIASSPEGLGASVRPGLLLRAAEGIRRLMGRSPGNGTVCSYGKWHYGWHGGFLVFSTSKEYVEAALNGQSVSHDGNRNALLFRTFGDDALKVAIQGSSGLPISGSVRAGVQHSDLPLTLPESWSNPPILSVSVRKPSDWAGLARIAAPWFAGPHWREWAVFLETVWKRWDVPNLAEGWESGIAETSLALTDVDTTSNYPIPVLACIMRSAGTIDGKHPLEAVAANGPVYPAEWNGEPGLRIPWLGEGVALCLGRAGRDWLATSCEPAMAQLASAQREGPPVDADVALRIDWAGASRVLRQSIRQSANWKLLPEMAMRDGGERLDPLFDFLSKAGRTTVNGRCRDGLLVFDGFLAKP